jgi:hypothetical protein
MTSVSPIKMQTEKGMSAYSTTENNAVDFFGSIVRSTPVEKAVEMFVSVLKSDFKLAMALLYNLRDCRTGKGEKNLPVQIMHWMSQNMKEAYKANLRSFLKYGYYDDLLHLDEMNKDKLTKEDNTLTPELKIFVEDLKQDYNTLREEEKYNALPEPKEKQTFTYTLASKWAPTESCSFDKKCKSAKRIAKALFKSLGFTLDKTKKQNPLTVYLKSYRNVTSELRKRLKIVERYESAKLWGEINYAQVPATCMKKQKEAFKRHDEERFNKFISDVSTGKTKINTTGIEIHTLISKYIAYGGVLDPVSEVQIDTIIQKLREAGTFSKTMAVVDVSGSMSGEPIEVAIALGIVVSLLTNDNFKRKFFTFNTVPTLCNLVGETYYDMAKNLQKADWGGTTNFISVFEQILQYATTFSLSQDQMIEKVFVFTDMQFDQADNSYDTAYEIIQKKYDAAGYRIPTLIFWNLRCSSVGPTFAVKSKQNNVALMSGFSTEMLKSFLNNPEVITPYAVMMQTLEKYFKDVIGDYTYEEVLDEKLEKTSIEERVEPSTTNTDFWDIHAC